jgi:hypothetical protein
MTSLRKSCRIPSPRLPVAAFALLGTVSHVATGAAAGPSADGFQYRASLYAYLPDASGALAVPAPVTISADANDILRHTNTAFMGAFEARRGSFGVFADGISISFGDSRSGLTHLSFGNGITLPPGVSADTSIDIKMRALTLATEYRAVATQVTNIDLFAGARLLDIPTTFRYAFNADFGPFSGPARQGDRALSIRNWDATTGVKIGVARSAWRGFAYGDVGTGDSVLTWQALAGAGRRVGRADVLTGWRRVTYHFDHGAPLQSLNFGGPFLGVTLAW